METCSTKFCTNIAEVEKLIDAPFTMTSAASQSIQVIRICRRCAAQDERQADLTKSKARMAQ